MLSMVGVCFKLAVTDMFVFTSNLLIYRVYHKSEYTPHISADI